jgi:aspartyl-tRNA(Asn)/glutamyl-tRNA(Gln) amidotransferase subunit B
VNVSLMPCGSERLGKRTETKNVNSLRSVERAVRFEIERQAAVLDAGGRVVQETRHFHEDSVTTTSGRSKEEAQDYRYFPEPDLVPVAPSREWVEEIGNRVAASLQIKPQFEFVPVQLGPTGYKLESQFGSPSAHFAQIEKQWGLTHAEMDAIRNAGAFDVVAQTVATGVLPAAAYKWWLGPIARRANELGKDLNSISQSIPPTYVGQIDKLVSSGKLNDHLARDVIDGVLAGEGDPDTVVAARHLAVVSDSEALTQAVDEAIAANPDVAAKVREGKGAAVGPLVGAVMKATGGKADASRVRELVLERLS